MPRVTPISPPARLLTAPTRLCACSYEKGFYFLYYLQVRASMLLRGVLWGVAFACRLLVVSYTGVYFHHSKSFHPAPQTRLKHPLPPPQELVGGSVRFDPFLSDYIAAHRHQTLTSDQFKAYFLNYFKDVSNCVIAA